MSDPSFLENLTFFVEKVAVFKKMTSIGQDTASNARDGIKAISYKPEFTGIKTGRRSSNFIAECNHGRVVDALEAVLRRKHKSGIARFFNNQSIDLGMTEDNKVIAIFEVKTDPNTQSIYTGVGQLLFHAVSDNLIMKTLVLPRNETIDRRWVSVLKKLGIALLEYEVDANQIQFIGQ